MKTKLNLTIDEDLIPRSKAFARTKGQSVSQLVEDLLRDTINIKDNSFSDRWRGNLKISSNSDARYLRLKNRYNL